MRMVTLATGSLAALVLLAGACSSATSATSAARSSGMCQFVTDAGVVYSCSTLTNLTSTGLAENCPAPGQFTAAESCSSANAVGTCTITLSANGASIIAYYYAPNTCEEAQTSCSASMSAAAAGTTVSFQGNGC